MIARDSGRAPLLRSTVAFAAILALGGCTTFGSNVKGSFSCKAPDGICAPSSSIDDRALAMISGDGEGDLVPAGPYPADRERPGLQSTSAQQRLPRGQIDPRRTQERVLRIVFQPYIDGRGRLHEASAVHAVVQTGEWQQQTLAYATPIPDRLIAEGPRSENLADAVDRAELASVQAAASDQTLPDPAVVAAASARRADPVKAIQDDVAARLAPKANRTPVQPAADTSARATEHRAEGGLKPVAASAPVATVGSTGPKPVAEIASPVAKAATGAEAIARIKATPDYQAAAARAESEARAAPQSGAMPEAAAKPKATVRAAAFPAAAPEDN